MARGDSDAQLSSQKGNLRSLIEAAAESVVRFVPGRGPSQPQEVIASVEEGALTEHMQVVVHVGEVQEADL